LEAVTLVCDGDIELPAWPIVSLKALQFLDIDECHIHETNESGEVEWFECTRFDPTLAETVVGYITESDDVVGAFD